MQMTVVAERDRRTEREKERKQTKGTQNGEMVRESERKKEVSERRKTCFPRTWEGRGWEDGVALWNN